MHSKKLEYVQTIFNGRREVLEILNSGQELMSYFLNTAGNGCPLINASISTLIGKGAQGEVYSVSYPKKSRKEETEYVVKVSNSHLFDLELTKPGRSLNGALDFTPNTTVNQIADELFKIRGVPRTITISVNGGDPSTKIKDLENGEYRSVIPTFIPRYNPDMGGDICARRNGVGASRSSFTRKVWECTLGKRLRTPREVTFVAIRVNPSTSSDYCADH